MNETSATEQATFLRYLETHNVRALSAAMAVKAPDLW